MQLEIGVGIAMHYCVAAKSAQAGVKQCRFINVERAGGTIAIEAASSDNKACVYSQPQVACLILCGM